MPTNINHLDELLLVIGHDDVIGSEASVGEILDGVVLHSLVLEHSRKTVKSMVLDPADSISLWLIHDR